MWAAFRGSGTLLERRLLTEVWFEPQDDAQVQWAVKEAEDKLRANDLDGANLAIAKAEQLEYELAKRHRRLTHDAPRLAQQLQAEAEAELKSGHLDQAEKALTRAEQLRRWHSKK